ncbi:MAG TPA: hypothetical protein PKE45_15160 [Caldilineaceae bacterium]|nr:hypothetical protein [Caldilineaceae bacterium]
MTTAQNLELHQARILIGRWAQRGLRDWDIHRGYDLIAKDKTEEAYYARKLAIPYYDREAEPIREVDICTLTDAKQLVKTALLQLGHQPGRGNWILRAWKHYRGPERPQDLDNQ